MLITLIIISLCSLVINSCRGVGVGRASQFSVRDNVVNLNNIICLIIVLLGLLFSLKLNVSSPRLGDFILVSLGLTFLLVR